MIRRVFNPTGVVRKLNVVCIRNFSATVSEDTIRDGHRSHVHFKVTQKPHPLIPSKSTNASGNLYETDDYVQGDHTGRQQNHIWTKEELHEKMSTLYRHKPKTLSDHITNKAVSLHVVVME